jgi:hypothetical protein
VERHAPSTNGDQPASKQSAESALKPAFTLGKKLKSGPAAPLPRSKMNAMKGA